MSGTPKFQPQNQNSFIIQQQNVGHQKAQLLAIVPVRTAQGAQSYLKCDPPFYLALTTSELDSIDIKILNEKGEPFPFTPDTNVISAEDLTLYKWISAILYILSPLIAPIKWSTTHKHKLSTFWIRTSMAAHYTQSFVAVDSYNMAKASAINSSIYGSGCSLH